MESEELQLSIYIYTLEIDTDSRRFGAAVEGRRLCNHVVCGGVPGGLCENCGKP